MVRAPVLVMTLSSALAGVLLALNSVSIAIDVACITVVGLLLAHATNNLVNDWVDHISGVDKDNYFRSRYGTHVLEEQLLSVAGMALVTFLTGGLALLCGVYIWFATEGGVEITALIVAGAVLVLFYTWPLKHFALGEVAVFLVWGPLMTAGTCFVLTTELTWEVFWVSLLVGMGPTLVILGKHIDKLQEDQQKSVKTLPVVLGSERALFLTRMLLSALWVLFAIVVLYYQYFALLICLVAVGSAWRLHMVLGQGRPEQKPMTYPQSVWPLWYSAYAFRFTRSFGLACLAGLVLHLFL